MTENEFNKIPDYAINQKRECPTVGQTSVIMLLLTLWCFVMQYLVVVIIGSNPDIYEGFENNATVYYFINAVYEAVYLGLPILLIFGRFKGSTEKMARFNPLSSREIAILLSLGVLAFFANLLLTSASVELASIFTNVEIPEVPPAYETTDIVTMMIVYIVIAPVLEEMILRGIIMRGLEGVSKWFAIIVTAFFFSILHLSYYTIIPKFIGGIIMGYVVFSTNSLYAGIIVHIINNAISGIFSIISDNSNIVEDSEAILGEITMADRIFSIVLSVGMAIGAIVVIIALLVIMKNGSRTPDGEGGYIHKGVIRQKYDCEKPVALYKYLPMILSLAILLAYIVTDIIACWK